MSPLVEPTFWATGVDPAARRHRRARRPWPDELADQLPEIAAAAVLADVDQAEDLELADQLPPRPCSPGVDVDQAEDLDFAAIAVAAELARACSWSSALAILSW